MVLHDIEIRVAFIPSLWLVIPVVSSLERVCQGRRYRLEGGGFSCFASRLFVCTKVLGDKQFLALMASLGAPTLKIGGWGNEPG